MEHRKKPWLRDRSLLWRCVKCAKIHPDGTKPCVECGSWVRDEERRWRAPYRDKR